MKELDPAERRRLRASAHPLHPVVSIGAEGLSEAVLKEIDRALIAHELIKVRIHGADRGSRSDCLARICAALEASPVQHIGNILILYRAKPEAPAKGAGEKAETRRQSGKKRDRPLSASPVPARRPGRRRAGFE